MASNLYDTSASISLNVNEWIELLFLSSAKFYDSHTWARKNDLEKTKPEMTKEQTPFFRNRRDK